MVILNMNTSVEKRRVSIYVIFLYLFSQRFCECAKKDCKYEKPEVEETLKPFLMDPQLKCDIISFCGFLNGNDNSKMFFWYFPSESDESKDPIIVWLQGDLKPSIEGLFENNGPVYAKTKHLNQRKYYWSQKVSMLYLDTVIGSGFSHTGSSKIYPNNMDDLVSNVFESLKYFFSKFTHLNKNDLYLAGDGLACQIITNLAKLIDSNKERRLTTINLKGLIIENGICDPINSVVLASHYYNLRMLDSWKQDDMIQQERRIQDLLRSQKFNEAYDEYDKYIKGIITPYKTMFNNKTYYETSYNLLYPNKYWAYEKYTTYIQQNNIKHNIHVNSNSAFHSDTKVLEKFKGELMKSSTTNLGKLADKYRVLMYYGQMNPEISPNAGYKTASSLRWCGSELFQDVQDEPLFVNKILYGYVVIIESRSCKGSLTWAIVKNAGQKIADHKPEEVLDLINKFITKSF